MLKRLAVAGLLAALVPLQAAALDRNDLLALVAMPLAVAAVSEITDVPANELVDVITLLNDAAVPPAQFVEVVRYVPVALVVETNDGPDFVQFIRTQQLEGVRGTRLVTVIEQRYRLLGVPDVELNVVAPRLIAFDDDTDDIVFVPQVVRTRVTEVTTRRAHPHGGPPGQLKKLRGVQTGAEIVHEQRAPRVTRTTRMRDDDDDRGKNRGQKPARVAKPPKAKHDDGDRSGRGRGSDDQDKGHGKDHGKDKGKGKGKG